jgi:hypothetical protein
MMIRTAVAVLSAVLLSAFASAQGQAPAPAPAPAPAVSSAPDPRQAALKKLHDQETAALDAVRADKTLTGEQKRAKMAATLSSFQDQRDAVMGMKRSPAMKALNAQEAAALKAIHDDAALSPDQKKAKNIATLKDFQAQRQALSKSEGSSNP